MAGSHHDRIREAFSRQAATFEDASLNSAFTTGLPWLLGLVDPRSDDVVLDAAAGTGLVGRALALGVARVTAVDATPAMVAEGRAAAAAEGRDNVEFVVGSVESLPFPDDSFTLVVSRFSMHHLSDPRSAISEMVRVLRPGGRLVVQDLVASNDPEEAACQDHVERLRDPSHLRMPPRGAVRTWLRGHDLDVHTVVEREVDRPVEQWLEQAVTDPEDAALVREAFETDIAGGRSTGLRPHHVDHELWFSQLWEVTVARRR